MNLLKTIFTLLLLSGTPIITIAQLKQAVKWQFSAVKLSDNEVALHFYAVIDSAWQLYPHVIDRYGVSPVAFRFEPSDEYELAGRMEEHGTPSQSRTNCSAGRIGYARSVLFIQKLKVNSPGIVKGDFAYIACRGEEPHQAEVRSFSIAIIP